MTSSLDEIFSTLEQSSGSKTGDHLRNLVATLAEEHDGCALADELLAAFPEAVVIAGLQGDPTDKRRKGPLKAGVVGGHRMIWLTSTGWQQAGHSNRREHAPAASQLRHRYAAKSVEDWILRRKSTLAERELLLNTVRGGPLRAFVQDQVASAWGAVRMGGSRADEAGRLLGGVYPDLLVIESWPVGLASLRSSVYPTLVGVEAGGHGLFEHEIRVAVEVELSAKGLADLTGKVRNHDTAMSLGWWHACVWITDDAEVATRLKRSLATITGGESPAHYTAHTGDVGVEPIGDPVVATTWGWVPLLRQVDAAGAGQG